MQTGRAMKTTMTANEVFGSVSPGFEPVRHLLEEVVARGAEENCQLCVYFKGERVVDLWATNAASENVHSNRGCTSNSNGTHKVVRDSPSFGEPAPYDGDSLQNVFSSGKSLECVCMAILVNRDLIDYNDLVSDHWPEFGVFSKESVRICDVLRHESGLVRLARTVTTEELLPHNLKKNTLGSVIEASELRFPEVGDTVREYHAVTRGWILGEILRRVDPAGRTLGEFMRDEVAQPLRADLYIGIEDSSPLLSRIAPVSAWHPLYILAQSLMPAAFLGRRTETSFLELAPFYWRSWRKSRQPRPAPILQGIDPLDRIDVSVAKFNEPSMRACEISSGNAHCSARAMAKVAACVAGGGKVDGVRILSEKTVEKMMAAPIKRTDAGVDGLISFFTQGGVNIFKVFDEDLGPQRFSKSLREGFEGWQGVGGSSFQWHRKLEIGFAYVPTLVHYYDFANTRAAKLQHQVVKCASDIVNNSQE